MSYVGCLGVCMSTRSGPLDAIDPSKEIFHRKISASECDAIGGKYDSFR